jgi:hypothetical protein
MVKKLVAGTLCASMVMGMSVTAFADGETTSKTDDIKDAEGTTTTTGTGKVEGIVDKDVLAYVLPTSNNEFDFTLDPQGLIDATKTSTGAQIATSAAGGTLFFTDSDSKYNNTSAALTIYNAGTTKIDVTLNATVTGLTKDNATIALNTDKTFANDTSASIYLGVITKVGTGSADAAVAITEDGVSITKTLDAVASSKYETTKSGDTYSYSRVSGFSAATDGVPMTVSLEGASNSAASTADWQAVSAVKPGVDIVWTVEKHVDGPNFRSTSKGVITYKADEVTSIKSIKIEDGGVLYDGYNAYGKNWSAATDENGVITLADKYVNGFKCAEKEATITYVDKDNDEQTVKIVVKLAD